MTDVEWTPTVALQRAMTDRGMSAQRVRNLCDTVFEREKFSELTEAEQWTLVCLVDPESIGPYGESMAPF